jgi:FkbM family methyltransferase
MEEIDIPNVPPLKLDLGPRANSYFASSATKPNWEPLETQLFIRLLSEHPRVLDIGANIGWFTSIGAKLAGPAGQFYAFEPDRENFAVLINNICTHRLFNVRPLRIALGERDEDGQLFLSEENLGDHRISPVAGRQAVEIQIARLDTVLEGSGFVPDLIKIDVQGAERAAFEGGKDVLTRAGTKCAKLIEFWPGGMQGGIEEATALADLIFAWRQPVFVCHHEGIGSIRSVDRATLQQAIGGCIHPSKPSYLDLLVAPDDDRMHRLQDFVGPAWQPWE